MVRCGRDAKYTINLPETSLFVGMGWHGEGVDGKNICMCIRGGCVCVWVCVYVYSCLFGLFAG